MKSYVEGYTSHLEEALKIGRSTSFQNNNSAFQNILITGLGGSGIGGTMASQLLANQLTIPVIINKDYAIPSFVNESTLVLACSYSGNTEETLEAIEKSENAGAEICIISSGGKAVEIANENNYNKIDIPGGHPPRAAFGWSFPQIFFALEKYGLIGSDFESSIENSINSINNLESNIIEEAKSLTEKLYGKIAVIYSDASSEGVAVRFRQQVNENSKMLCWHHALPEMNHNELVGWTAQNDDLAVVVFRNDTDYRRTQKRMEFSKSVIEPLVSSYTEIYSKGNSDIEKALYLVHLGDWISVLLAEKKDIDAVEVNIITKLKGQLAEF